GAAVLGFLQYRYRDVDPSLRTRPLLVEAALTELLVGHEVGYADDAPDVAEQRGGHRTELGIGLLVELHVVRVGARIAAGVDALVHRVLHQETADLTVYKLGDRFEHAGPQHRVERSVVDARDDVVQSRVFVAHEIARWSERTL